MFFIYYIIRDWGKLILARCNKCNSDLYRSWRMYYGTPQKDRKNFLKVLVECNKLASYWRCFPDTYFRNGMFLKTYGSYENMFSHIPQKAYSKIVSRTPHNAKYNILIDDKILFHDIMRAYGFPTTERFFVYANGSFYKDGKNILEQEVNYIISQINDERIFVKRFTGGAASGISIFTKSTDGYYSNGKKLSVELIKSKYGTDKYIFEKQIHQEPILGDLNKDTVNTIRILTFKNEIIAACVRVGREGTFVDNASVGGLVVNVDIKNGQLRDYATMFWDMTQYYEHPDTKKRFAGIIIPNWNQITDLVRQVCECMPYYSSVGFDIATTENGPVIIEINTGAGVNVVQTGCETGIASFFRN